MEACLVHALRCDTQLTRALINIIFCLYQWLAVTLLLWAAVLLLFYFHPALTDPSHSSSASQASFNNSCPSAKVKSQLILQYPRAWQVFHVTRLFQIRLPEMSLIIDPSFLLENMWYSHFTMKKSFGAY